MASPSRCIRVRIYLYHFNHDLYSIKMDMFLQILFVPALYVTPSPFSVEGGHRAIIFSRLGGIKSETYSEGLHLRMPWFQYPIIYDIR